MTAAGDTLQAPFDGAALGRRTLRGAGVTAVAQAAKFGLQFGSQIVLARMLDPAQFGLVALVAPVLGLVLSLNDFGLGQAIVQRAQITPRQVSALFWLNTAIGAGFTLAAMCAAPLIALLYGEPRTLAITLASAALILLSSLAVVPLALLNRELRFTALAAVELGAMVLGLGSGIASAWLGAGYWSLVVMQAVNATAVLAAAWACAGWLPQRPAREPGVGAMLRFGSRIMGSNLAAYVSMSADNVIVGAVNGKVALGLYDRSYNMVVRPLMQLMAPAGRVAVPLLSRLQATPGLYARAYLLLLQATTAACVPGLVAVAASADPLVLMLLGPKWAAMVPVFAWIAIGGIASPLSASAYWLFTSQNRADEQLRYGIAAACISVAAFAIGSVWGVVGVATVSALAFVFVQAPLLAWAATRRGPVTAAPLLGALAPLLAAGVACGLVTGALMHWLDGPRPALVAAAFVAAYGSFALALLTQPAGRRLVADTRRLLASRDVAR